jgi:hypothetical protein
MFAVLANIGHIETTVFPIHIFSWFFYFTTSALNEFAHKLAVLLLFLLLVVNRKPLVATPAEIATTTTAWLGSGTPSAVFASVLITALLLRTILTEPGSITIRTTTLSLSAFRTFFVWINVGALILINPPFVI